MRAGDVARDRKAEARAAFILVARIVQPQERLEHFLAHLGRNAGAVVIDGDGEIAVVAMAGDGDLVGMPRRVGYEVGEAALERGRLDRDHRESLERNGGGMSMRSEERRVGKECRSRGAQEHEKKKNT